MQTPEPQTPEEYAVFSALENIQAMSDMQRKANADYAEKVILMRGERRDMYKYLGTIAAGAAALAPNVYDHVKDPHYFFIGVALELVCVAIAMTYLLGTVERDAGELEKSYQKTTNQIQGMREKYIAFVESKNHAPDAYIALNNDVMGVAKGAGTQSRPRTELKWGFYKPLDHFTEYLLFTFISGSLLIVMSIYGLQLSIVSLVTLLATIFIAICIVAISPSQLFVILGFPIGAVRGFIAHKILKREGPEDSERKS